MISAELKAQYKTVVGLEVHSQLQTESKIFASDPNFFGAEANTNIGVITLAHPGVLPKLNKKAVEYAIKWGLACNCEIREWQYFDRKNYFYPDLPKGYQITQDKTPVCGPGFYPIRFKNAEGKTVKKAVQIHHIHMEEDAGKSIHTDNEQFTQLDYNRAGTPLLEMVTEPCIESGEEAAAFMAEMRKLVRYLGIGDGNMDEGSLRCDVNISVMPVGSTVFGTKVEVKNMNSMKFIQKAIEYEVERQILAYEAGEKIIQETRSFDPTTNTTNGMREKETMNDYRYFPEPDMPPFEVKQDWVQAVKQQMPELPNQQFEKFTAKFGINEADAYTLTEDQATAQYFTEIAIISNQYKAASNWVLGPIRSYLNDQKIEIPQFEVSPSSINNIIQLINQNKVSFTAASQKLFPALVANPTKNVASLAQELNIIQESDSNSIQPIINEVLAAMPDKVKEYNNGKKGLLALFIGEVMKKSKGKADPKLTSSLVIASLAKI